MTFLTYIIVAFSLEPRRWGRTLNGKLNRARLGVDRTELGSHNSMDLNQSTTFLGPTRFMLNFGLIACLIPYVYFRFQVGPLCFKSLS